MAVNVGGFLEETSDKQVREVHEKMYTVKIHSNSTALFVVPKNNKWPANASLGEWFNKL